MTETKELIECVICGEPIRPDPFTGWAGGNNAQPVKKGRCCDDCDWSVVIPERIMMTRTMK